MQARVPGVVLAAVVVLGTMARAADGGGPEVVLHVTEAAAAVAVDDRARAETAAASAVAELADWRSATSEDARAQRRLERLSRRLAAARGLMADPTATRRDILRRLELAARTALRARRHTTGDTGGPALDVRPRSTDTVRRGGRAVLLVARSAPATVAETLPAAGAPFADSLLPLGAGRYRLATQRATGAARIELQGTGEPGFWIVVRGRRADLTAPLSAVTTPLSVVYGAATLFGRVGAPLDGPPPIVIGGRAATFSVSPTLPDGLLLDTTTGQIAGTPESAAFAATFTVTASGADGAATTEIAIEVSPALPAGILLLADGLTATRVADVPAVPVKLAFTPDGRLLFDELTTGNVRLIDPSGTLAPTPIATLPILTGGGRGLLGIAVSPDFASSGQIVVFASTAAGDGHGDRNRLLRLTLAGDVAVATDVLVDDLPIGQISNGGCVAFGPDGNLWVTIGDTGDDALAQTDGARAGRVLRFTPDGGVPADNPFPGDPEWCRGLRNSFGLAFHARTGGVFVSENGPTAHDELDFVQAGKNFEWGPTPPDLPDFARGLRLMDWTPVIVPTAITFTARGRLAPVVGPDDLLLGSYDAAEIRRLRLSGALLTDVDDEDVLVAFEAPEAITNKPLDVVEGPDGALYVATFSAIWRIDRWAPPQPVGTVRPNR